jgi:GT2 family glycosyltransferase
VHDLSVIIVSTNEAKWLEPCLRTLFDHAGDLRLDVVVVDNDSSDGTAELVRTRFPAARVVHSENHGFAHANNRALFTCDARYVLFLNPDTIHLEGRLDELIARLDAAPEVGLAGCRQYSPEGQLWPTMRYFPSSIRALMEALGSEQLPRRTRWMGMSEINLSRYDQEFDLDWTSGSFMLARREALESAGWLDERLFLYADDIDVARRIKTAGWVVRHFPCVRIVHHAGKAGFNPRRFAQFTYAQKLYAEKFMSPLQRRLFCAALGVRYITRLVAYGLVRRRPGAPAAMRAALRVLAGREGSPYEEPPPMAVRPWEGRAPAPEAQERLAIAR